MDYAALKFWLSAAEAIIVTALFIYTWWTNRQRATKAAIRRVEENVASEIKIVNARLGEHNDRLLSIERELQHLPNTKDIHEVHYRVDQVGQGVSNLEGQMTQINTTLHLIQQHLMGTGQ